MGRDFPRDRFFLAAFLAAALVMPGFLGGCGLFTGENVERDVPEDLPGAKNRPAGTAGQRKAGLFGDEGLVLIGPDRPDGDLGGSPIAVNAYLWRASLDTLSFMPLNSADPFGGVIITDWHAPLESPGERFKVTAYILGRQLRADGVRIAVFREVQDETGTWRTATVAPETARKLEDSILTRARELRVAGL
jgi:hypothetical protein